MARKRKVEAHFLHHGRWWVAWTDDVPGAVTQGRTLDEARENLRDAIQLMPQPLEDVPKAQSSERYVRETLSL